MYSIPGYATNVIFAMVFAIKQAKDGFTLVFGRTEQRSDWECDVSFYILDLFLCNKFTSNYQSKKGIKKLKDIYSKISILLKHMYVRIVKSRTTCKRLFIK